MTVAPSAPVQLPALSAPPAPFAPVQLPAPLRAWLDDVRVRFATESQEVPLDRLDGWHFDPATGDLRHRTGRFFTVEGLSVTVPDGPVRHWEQPILAQPEVGILGLLVRRDREGRLHCLMQAKAEPGNADGIQLSPTVQATRSNYTRVHGGKAVPYLDLFRREGPGLHRLADVRQSEQGTWFARKRNRNMIVETDREVPAQDGFRWFPLSGLHALLAARDLVNMDARSVLACLPPPGPDPGSLHSDTALLGWITEVRSRTEVHTERVPLAALDGWHRTGGRISHESGRWFDVLGLRVRAVGREIGGWSQPMIAPRGRGVAAFLTRRFDGVRHVAVRARVEPGYVDVAELGPTVQCNPANLDPRAPRPAHLDEVLGAPAGRVLHDAVLSEEGGRFHHARNRYLIVETEAGPAEDDPDFRWVTAHQLGRLLRHSHYVNVEARTLLACLHGLGPH
ncbi:NDP-hexose 2,3-dehydratase family protein [Streptomyces sp. CA-294286]|uniref:NDP-hexose 2,3-dehydratase family protein n=1 Tax=Streptomyces sp. CA-294286 TaxID=3240070 RepID=UPI003D8C4EC8